MTTPKPLQWDTEAWHTLRNEKLHGWLLGSQEAVAAYMMISNISEVWDDLADGDALTMGDINGAFIDAMVLLRDNAFYRQHESMIHGQIIVGINAWFDSLPLERGDTVAERMMAYYLRNYSYEILNIFAYCVGGWAHMRAVSGEMRKFLTHETYDQWEHAL